MELKPLSFNKDYDKHAYMGVGELLNKEGVLRRTNQGYVCWADFNLPELYRTNHIIVLKLTENLLPYNEEDIKTWLWFCEQCGFPSEYLGKQDDSFVIKLDSSKYVSWLHWFTSLTCIRYAAFHCSSNGETLIPKLCIDLMIKLGDKLDPIEILQLAHYGYSNGYWDTLHTLLGGVAYLIDKQTLIKGFTEQERIDKIFFINGYCNVDKYELMKKFKEKDYDYLIKTLKKTA